MNQGGIPTGLQVTESGGKIRDKHVTESRMDYAARRQSCRQQAKSQLCKSALCTQQAGQHQTMLRNLSVLIFSSCTHGFIATCCTYNLTHLRTWCAVDAHKANKGKAAVPEGMQDNVLNLQVIQEVLAQLGDCQPFLLALPS